MTFTEENLITKFYLKNPIKNETENDNKNLSACCRILNISTPTMLHLICGFFFSTSVYTGHKN